MNFINEEIEEEEANLRNRKGLNKFKRILMTNNIQVVRNKTTIIIETDTQKHAHLREQLIHLWMKSTLFSLKGRGIRIGTCSYADGTCCFHVCDSLEILAKNKKDILHHHLLWFVNWLKNIPIQTI